MQQRSTYKSEEERRRRKKDELQSFEFYLFYAEKRSHKEINRKMYYTIGK